MEKSGDEFMQGYAHALAVFVQGGSIEEALIAVGLTSVGKFEEFGIVGEDRKALEQLVEAVEVRLHGRF